MNQIDYTGISILITSIGSFITVIVGVWITINNSKAARKDAAEGKQASVEAKAQSVETSKKVDGTLTKLEDAAFAKGELSESRTQQRVAVALSETSPDAKAILAALAKLLKVENEK